MPSITLMNCDTEPVHAPDAIQPFGYLLALDHETITHWSSNISALTSSAATSAPAAQKLFSGESLDLVLASQRRSMPDGLRPPVRLRLANGAEMRALRHRQGGRVVLEL